MRTEIDDGDHIEIQMAPLIDCVFLLLIFFLVATTLKKVEKELPLDLPQSQASVLTRQVDETFIIAIDKAGKTYMGTQPVTLGSLHDKLKEIAAQTPNRRIRLDVDRSAPFQYIVPVLDLCQFEGLNHVGLHTESRHGTRN